MSEGKRQKIGHLAKKGHLTTATCAFTGCGWHWSGNAEEAEKNLRSHADIVHPPVVEVYRDL